MRKLVMVLLTGLLVLAFSAPAYAHDGKVHGKNMSSPGHGSVGVADRGKGKGKGSDDDDEVGARSSHNGKKLTFVFVGIVHEHVTGGGGSTTGAFTIKAQYGNSAASRLLTARTTTTVTFEYQCLRYVGGKTNKGGKSQCLGTPKKKQTHVSKAGKLKGSPETGDPLPGDIVIVLIQAPSPTGTTGPITFVRADPPKQVSIKNKGVGVEGLIHSVSTTPAELVVAKNKRVGHQETTVSITPTTKIYIGKTLSDLNALYALQNPGGTPLDHAIRVHVRLQAGTTNAVVIRAKP